MSVTTHGLFLLAETIQLLRTARRDIESNGRPVIRWFSHIRFTVWLSSRACTVHTLVKSSSDGFSDFRSDVCSVDELLIRRRSPRYRAFIAPTAQCRTIFPSVYELSSRITHCIKPFHVIDVYQVLKLISTAKRWKYS